VTKELLFSRVTWEFHANAMHHIQTGCASDTSDVNYCYLVSSQAGTGKTTFCVRGTSQLEGFHNHLHHIIPSLHSSPKIMTRLLYLFVFQWNSDRSVERGELLSKCGEWYNHNVILQLQILLQDTSCEDVVGDYTHYQDFVGTK
jgi:hypothetical protein